jgi:nicotinate-nucleotide adenylyltransferase
MRLGLFGGRFDPPHLGHLIVAEQAREQLALDELHFIPSPSPPHKAAAATPEQRYEMLLLATTSHPAFVVSRLELERAGPSYSFDTVREVGRRHKGATLFFITGIDAYREIASWHRADELVEAVQMIAVPRPGYTLDGIAPYYRTRVRTLDMPEIGLSSTLVRERLARGHSVRYLVPELVESYLARHHLYRQPVQPR